MIWFQQNYIAALLWNMEQRGTWRHSFIKEFHWEIMICSCQHPWISLGVIFYKHVMLLLFKLLVRPFNSIVLFVSHDRFMKSICKPGPLNQIVFVLNYCNYMFPKMSIIEHDRFESKFPCAISLSRMPVQCKLSLINSLDSINRHNSYHG